MSLCGCGVCVLFSNHTRSNGAILTHQRTNTRRTRSRTNQLREASTFAHQTHDDDVDDNDTTAQCFSTFPLTKYSTHYTIYDAVSPRSQRAEKTTPQKHTTQLHSRSIPRQSDEVRAQTGCSACVRRQSGDDDAGWMLLIFYAVFYVDCGVAERSLRRCGARPRENRID